MTMGFRVLESTMFAFLFPHSEKEPGPGAGLAELMGYGKRRLFAGKAKAAARAFERAAEAAPADPLPLAYRSWAGRLEDKARAVVDAEKAVGLDPDCAEAHMSLALALVTGAPNFELAGMALSEGRKLPPADADGAVLAIGVYLLFADALASLKDDEEDLTFAFKATPLRDAADQLLSGRQAAAFAAFKKIFLSGREAAGGLGIAAAAWAMRDKESARTFATLTADSGVLKEPGLLAAVRAVQKAS